jgi:hypothetical protein
MEEAFRKYTNIDHSFRGEAVLLGQYFITQSTPDISWKLQKPQLGPQRSHSF